MNNTTPKRIALIGGAGFIGHNIALELKKRGHDVHVVDSLFINNLLYFSSTNNTILNRDLYLKMINERISLLNDSRIQLHVQDAREYYQLTHTLNKIKPQTIILLAAVAHADRSNKDPYSTFDHSFRTLENALDFARNTEWPAEHFIYFSSSMVYGNFPGGHVTEETPCEPLGIYGALKFGGEKLVIAYNQVFNLPYTIVRPSALYGERCVSRRVAQIFIENALQGRDISIKGDGSDRLDFTYIGDLVSGIVNVVENDNSKNQIFNMTYGESRSIGDLARIVSELFPDIKVHYDPKDSLMPDRGTLSVEKAEKMIGYAPQYPIEKGLKKYIDWYRSIL
ncbi:MAG TPA: NAD(P)-dependent oxidoreductase [Syntrophorhabdaceae bacterium]|jgi:nucleoside-diphosphate-sugar epimerase|nr:NAD(P)-dependent oxidoreductase [Syntrophorhabdaceae bacterium]HOS05271.1 NAD(P)-dependent oxidoreductase [Syntrophorhabdaceae bacterium]HPL40350.1 NAD(P)-dependent oxidoreductase [Syntrophorhabdaceae bacterium]